MKTIKLTAALFAGVLSFGAAHAQIYLANGGNSTLAEYNLDGTPVSVPFAPGKITRTRLYRRGTIFLPTAALVEQ